MNLLIGYFMPYETDVIDHLLVEDGHQYIVLGDDIDTPLSVLGTTTYM